jgi:NAD(P)-dependent dehydrogenase (short-subunit alcohol dehydrogenase family)
MRDVFRDDIMVGKAVYVAGGTRGMNLAIAKKLASKGAAVAVMSRNEERVAAATAELKAINPDCMGFSADARDYDRVAETMAAAAEAFGGLDIVVAGQAGNFYAPVTHLSTNGFKAIVDIDLVGTYNVFKASYEHLRAPGASLIAITAPEAVRPLHFQAHVCAAKAGVNMLIRVMALEWGPKGIRVNGISPGPIEGSWGMANVASPTQDIVDKITRAIPLKRWGTEEDIATTALYLSSDAASYVTGVILECDGGVTIASPEGGEIDAMGDLTRDNRVKRK